jgi:hypothetical protein
MSLNIKEGTPVRIYWNLHKECYSVQTKKPVAFYDAGDTLRVRNEWRVAGHADRFAVNNAEFKVSLAGNQRVRDEGKKNVHAFITGNWTDGWNPYPKDWEPARYNPHKLTTFVVGDGDEPIDEARYAQGMEWGQLWISNDRPQPVGKDTQ